MMVCGKGKVSPLLARVWTGTVAVEIDVEVSRELEIDLQCGLTTAQECHILPGATYTHTFAAAVVTAARK